MALAAQVYLQVVFPPGAEGAGVAHEGLDVLVFEEMVSQSLTVGVLLAALVTDVRLFLGVGALVPRQGAASVGTEGGGGEYRLYKGNKANSCREMEVCINKRVTQNSICKALILKPPQNNISYSIQNV